MEPDGEARLIRVNDLLSHNRPGSGPKLHRHPYEEVFIVQEGEVRFTAGDRTIEARSGDIVVVPARMPHKFVSHGDAHRQVGIHPPPAWRRSGSSSGCATGGIYVVAGTD